MTARLTVGLDFILPPEVSGGATSEVFTITRIITQPGLKAVVRGDGTVAQKASPPATTVALEGVSTSNTIAIGIEQLAELGWQIEPATQGSPQ